MSIRRKLLFVSALALLRFLVSVDIGPIVIVPMPDASCPAPARMFVEPTISL